MAHARCPQPRSIAQFGEWLRKSQFSAISHYRNGRGGLTTPRRSHEIIMVDRKEDQSTQFRDTSSGNFEQAAKTATQTQVDPSLADAQTVAQSLGVDLNTGLSQAEAKRRLDKYGPNELASAPPVPKWKKFLEQFKDPLVYLLLAATGISLVAWFIERANAVPGAEGGEALPFDAIVIVLILIVNAVLGYIQESKAEAAVEALSSMTAPQTNVLRDGKIERINTVDVVPGDIIVLGEATPFPRTDASSPPPAYESRKPASPAKACPSAKRPIPSHRRKPSATAPTWCSTARP